MKRKAAIVWEGSLLDGKGVITDESRIFVDTQNYRARSGVREGNHAELIAAAIAVCFAMDLTRQLGQTGLAPERIDAAVAVILEEQPAGWTITSVQLDVSAQVRGA